MFPRFSSKFIRKDDEVPLEVPAGAKEGSPCDSKGARAPLRVHTVVVPKVGTALRQLDLANLNREGAPPTEIRNKKAKMAFYDKICSQVGDGLFVGGETVAKNRDILRGSKITHVINCVGFLYPSYFKDEFKYQTLYLQGT